MTFGPASVRDPLEKQLVIVTPPAGPCQPLLVQRNPLVWLPSDPGPTPSYNGRNHTNGFLSLGALDTNPATPSPARASVRFTRRGNYLLECLIHPGMEATVHVR